MRIALLTVLLTGCGGEIFYRCSDSVFAEVRAGWALDCAESRRATDLAARLLHDSGWWEHASTPLPLTVASTVVLPQSPPGHDWLGVTMVVPVVGAVSVDVGRDYRSVLHELLHVESPGELVHDESEDDHPGWEYDGRWALTNLYVYALTGYVSDYGGSVERSFPRLIAESLAAAGWGPMVSARAALVAQH